MGWQFRGTSAALSALALVVACTSSNSGQVSGGDAGSGNTTSDGGKGGSPASGGQGAQAGSNVNDAGAAGDAGTAGNSGTDDHLTGDPSSPATGALKNVPAPPAADADIVSDVIMSRLDVWLKPDATVGQVNAAIDAIGGHLLAMTEGSSVISVAFPAAADAAALEQKRQALEAAPGILSADLAVVTTTDNLPPEPANDETNVGHLEMARFPAAWNLKDVALKNCESRKVSVVVLDHFGAPMPPQFANEVPGFQAPTPAGTAEHGWRTSSNVAAASFTDGAAVSGGNPFTQCLSMQGVQAANLSAIELQARLWQSLPSGKVIVNVSLGHSAPAKCTNCVPSDFEVASTWLTSGIKAAIDWRALAHKRDNELLIAQSAGNDGRSAAGVRYPLFRDGQLSGLFSLPASPRIFGVLGPLGSPRLSLFDDTDAFAPESQYDNFPSLLPDAAVRASLLQLMNDQVPDDVDGEPGVVVVGATTRGEPNAVVPAPFSNSNGDVYAVGTAVPGVGFNGDTPDDGTSFSAPQVAGLASYLWLLSDDLRNKPTTFTEQAIVENARTTLAAGVPILDAYASALSLDAAVTPTPASAPMRLALLDLNGDGSFTESDVQSFATVLLNVSGQPPRNWDRYDLNGDGYSGGAGTTRFDLDRVGSLQYGLASYETAQETYNGQTMSFDESAVTDLQILCYYAYSGLYAGDPAARDLSISSACGVSPDAPPVYDPVECEKNNPEHIGTLHHVCAVQDAIGCCPGLNCVDPTPDDNYASFWCQ